MMQLQPRLLHRIEKEVQEHQDAARFATTRLALILEH